MVALAATLCLLLTSCVFGPRPTAEDVVGTWVHGDTRLTIEADGSFALTDAPLYTESTIGDDWRRASGATWSETGEWTFDDIGIFLSERQLVISREGSELVLSFLVDSENDNPRCFELVREGSTLDPREPEHCFSDAWFR